MYDILFIEKKFNKRSVGEMDVLYQLYQIEEQIEALYIELIHLSMHDIWDGEQYEYYVQTIKNLTTKERDLLADQAVNYSFLKGELQKVMISELPINLEHQNNAFLIRLDSRLDAIYGDPGIEYANALYYDIHKVTSTLLLFLIHNDYYEDIKEDLIRYYYDLIFLDDDMERDFYLHIESSKIELSSRIYQEDYPSFKYINQAIVLGEASCNIQNIYYLDDQLSLNQQVLLIIFILEVYARLALSEGETQEFLLEDVQALLGDEGVSPFVKDKLVEVGEVFRQVQNYFYFSR